MKAATLASFTLLALFASNQAGALNLYAGQAKAASVCAQCHGIKVPAKGAPFPSLAGADRDYLISALKQYRDKTRKSDIMNAMAGSLTDTDIDSLASYYSKQKP